MITRVSPAPAYVQQVLAAYRTLDPDQPDNFLALLNGQEAPAPALPLRTPPHLASFAPRTPRSVSPNPPMADRTPAAAKLFANGVIVSVGSQELPRWHIQVESPTQGHAPAPERRLLLDYVAPPEPMMGTALDIHM